MEPKNFSDLLLSLYLGWQEKEYDRKSLREFADFIGVSPQVLSRYWGGKRKPSQAFANTLYEIFGDERIYEFSGLPRPDARLLKINRVWYELPEENKNRMMSDLPEEYKTNG
jgi:transcriptional regulator with XRE-family HTH domain